jgi:hypothetical protein
MARLSDTRTQWWILAGVLAGGAIYMGTRARRQTIPVSERRIQWVDPDAPRRIRAYASQIERASDWPGLADFLVATAYIESRGNSQVEGVGGDNRALGWFQIRPQSSRAHELGLVPREALKREADQVALAAWYLHRMVTKHAAPDQVPDFLAGRRGWSSWSKVDDVDDPGFWKQLSMGYKAAGVHPDAMLEPATPGSWPGPMSALHLTRGVYA